MGDDMQRLFQYFNGANKDEKKFNLTTPVVTAFRPENNFSSASQDFVVSFYLPEKYQVSVTNATIPMATLFVPAVPFRWQWTMA